MYSCLNERQRSFNPKNFRNVNFYVFSSCAIETEIQNLQENVLKLNIRDIRLT